MISCELFRDRFAPSTEDGGLLEHVRSCDECLAFAADMDADILFRALGGDELVPPGGVDAFVDDVMREVRLRSTENSARHMLAWPRRLAVAAALGAIVTAGSLLYTRDQRVIGVPVISPVQVAAVKLTTKPVVEKYDSDNATIVEVPTEGVGDVRVVMVFDDKLPADL